MMTTAESMSRSGWLTYCNKLTVMPDIELDLTTTQRGMFELGKTEDPLALTILRMASPQH